MSKKYSNFFKIELFMLIFPLCSFSSAGPAATIDDYTTTQRYSLYDTHGKAPKGTSGKIALGKRGLIDYYLEYKILDYKKYRYSYETGFPFDYKPIFVNPGMLKEYELEIETSYFSEYSFSYTQSITREISNAFAVKFDIFNMAQVSSQAESSTSSTNTMTYSFGFGRQTTFNESFVFDLDLIPSGYVFTPVVICEAEIFTLSYDVYGDTWLGKDYTSNPEERASEQHLIVYDPTSLFLTVGIKKITSDSEEPEYFLSKGLI